MLLYHCYALAKEVLSCINLKTITIPALVTSICDDVFEDCIALESITFLGDTPPDVDLTSIPKINDPDFKIYVPYSTLNDYKNDSNFSTYADKIFKIIIDRPYIGGKVIIGKGSVLNIGKP